MYKYFFNMCHQTLQGLEEYYFANLEEYSEKEIGQEAQDRTADDS